MFKQKIEAKRLICIPPPPLSPKQGATTLCQFKPVKRSLEGVANSIILEILLVGPHARN